MRGDRPARSRSRRAASRAAPHARGSTPAISRILSTAQGCPACAGIDPPRTLRGTSRRWLPRMRGDRPAALTPTAARKMAAPHARGSTHGRGSLTESHRGCPACAGIDPGCRHAGRGAVGLPRMRGDRPADAVDRVERARAAPHARGSTREAVATAVGDGGCPACAGIDPYPINTHSLPLRLPRMRGDRPETHLFTVLRTTAAPHARGSTPVNDRVKLNGSGCPACAGIDPQTVARRCSAARLPRMRGDRPAMRLSSASRCAAAPHARGSTFARLRFAWNFAGCPACAGIDPRARRASASGRRLPRMRGDRPATVTRGVLTLSAAPHARGSTLRRAIPARPASGCPACAGIDPNSSPSSCGAGRLPRMRGDRPVDTMRSALVNRAAPHARGSTLTNATSRMQRAGCPACAGIDPVVGRYLAECEGLPRMRGDRPGVSAVDPDRRRAAPHARGSTLAAARERVKGRGCPACAGIDPKARAMEGSPRRLPRMRGDRPVQLASTPNTSRAAPHARGSTHVPALRGAPPRGCPACAGIDPRSGHSPAGCRGLPRMRGDRPDRRARGERGYLAAPHARGSTPAKRFRTTRSTGCPACAGIDPLSAVTFSGSGGLPRMRGDRPALGLQGLDAVEAAPHARGSTRMC